MVRRVGLSRGLRSADVRDVAQMAHIQALESEGAIQNADNPERYLDKITFNTTMSHLRDVIRRERRSAPLADLESETRGKPQTVPGGIQYEYLWNALQQLPETCRQMVIDVCIYEMTYDEVAAVAGCAKATVHSHVQRCLQQLRLQMATAWLLGKVTSYEQTPLERVSIQLDHVRGGGMGPVFSNGQGTFSCVFRTLGRYRLSATKKGFLPHEQDLDISEGTQYAHIVLARQQETQEPEELARRG